MKQHQREFTLIEKYFSNSTLQRNDVLLGIGDDCALLKVPANHILAVTIDTLVAGVHFFSNTSSHDLGYKSLAISLSDLAAMGATPAWVTLAITLPEANNKWLDNFCRGFSALAKEYSVQLVGGNTTKGPLTITTQAHGFLPRDKALTRRGAKIGDLIFVTGHLGDAGLALKMLLDEVTIPENHHSALLQKLYRPQPRITEGLMLLDFAHAAIDISDGLAADLMHILEKSEVGATIFVEDLPLSPTLQKCVPLTTALTLALSAGDDYELCFTISAKKLAKLMAAHNKLSTKWKQVGIIEAEPGLRIKYKNGKNFHITTLGYEHAWNQ